MVLAVRLIGFLSIGSIVTLCAVALNLYCCVAPSSIARPLNVITPVLCGITEKLVEFWPDGIILDATVMPAVLIIMLYGPNPVLAGMLASSCTGTPI